MEELSKMPTWQWGRQQWKPLHIFLVAKVTFPLMTYSSGLQPFWHPGLGSWRTIHFHRLGAGWEGVALGWLKHITLIVHFISDLLLPLIWQRYQAMAWTLGTPELKDISVKDTDLSPLKNLITHKRGLGLHLMFYIQGLPVFLNYGSLKCAG